MCYASSMNPGAAHVLALHPAQEEEIIAAVTALDWSIDPVTGPVRVIVDILAVPIEQAERILLRLIAFRKIQVRPDGPASNNLAESGKVRLVRSKWFRPEKEWT